ncbi:MAG: ligase-associated DNA damage response endonuclease PdeM [Hyphomicrobiales bacterium]
MNASLVAKMDAKDGEPIDASAGLPLQLGDQTLFAHAAGVLYWQDQETLIVSDLHLEKGSSFAAKQVFLPPYDTAATLDQLSRLIKAFEPQRVIALGDSFHDGAAPDRLSTKDQLILTTLVTGAEWIWISGNHDPDLPDHLGGSVMDEIKISGITFRHEPTKNPTSSEVAGHLHPCARIRGRGRTIRSRCFVASSSRLIMPAFGAFTGGLNVRDGAFDGLFPGGQYHAYVLGSKKLFPIANSSCLPG